MTEEKFIVGEGSAYPLNGLLTLPEQQDAPLPAVVFVHGSGASNMDEKVGRLTPFRDLSHGLARRGIASLRYDKRSFAHGMKMIKKKNGPITVREETIADAVLAADLLRKDERIDPDRIFIIGHSMGGMLAPRIDAEGGNFRGLVIMAGTLRRLEDVLTGQMEEMLASMKGWVRKLAEKQTQKLLSAFDGMYALSDEEAMAKKMGGGTTLYYFKEMGSHPAAGYLENLHKPMLIMQGEKDFQVKADLDYAGYCALLGNRPEVTFRLYPGLNHAFVPALSDDISRAKKEYALRRDIGEDVIGDLADWILSI